MTDEELQQSIRSTLASVDLPSAGSAAEAVTAAQSAARASDRRRLALRVSTFVTVVAAVVAVVSISISGQSGSTLRIAQPQTSATPSSVETTPIGATPEGLNGGPVEQLEYISSDEPFAPPSNGERPTLTAQQAWAHVSHKPIPGFVDYHYGLLTNPPQVTDQLVWGFDDSQPTACIGLGIERTPSSTLCIDWYFLDATSGRMLDGTEQQIFPAPTQTHSPLPSSTFPAGPVREEDQRFSPTQLVIQAPVSVIRWTMQSSNCSISMHWFLPSGDATHGAAEPCGSDGFTTSSATDFVSRGHVFSVIGGHTDSDRFAIRIKLADGAAEFPDINDQSWIAVVSRCGNFYGTRPVSVAEVRFGRRGATGAVVENRPIPSGESATRADCSNS